MIEVLVTATEDLSLGAAPAAGNVVAAHDHIPGTVLRGALAAAWIREHGTPDQVSAELRGQFIDLFERELAYGPLLPVGSSVVPLSVLRCKYLPQRECDGVAVDLATSAPGSAPGSCEVCGGPLQRSKGGLHGGIRLLDRTRTALESDETALDESLHTRRALPAGTELVGSISGTHPWLVSRAGSTVWFGGRKTVGGRARLMVRDAGSSPPPPQRSDGRVLVVLRSPAIFVDDAGRPTYELPLRDIEQALGTTVRVVEQWLRPTRVVGWHAASGLPKPQEVAVVAGSTFVLEPTGAPAVAGLAALEERGLGLRRAEGFGLISVNPPRWAPSPAQPASERRTSWAREMADRVRETIADPSLRDWLVKRLKQRRDLVELGTTIDDEALDLRRLRTAESSVRHLVDELMRIDDPSKLSDLIDVLEDPGVAR